MEVLLKKVCDRLVKGCDFSIRSLVFMERGDYGDIELKVLGNIADSYLRMRNARNTGRRAWTLEQYLDAAAEAGLAVEGGTVVLAPGCRIETKDVSGDARFAALGCSNVFFSPIRTAPETFAKHLLQIRDAIPEVCGMIQSKYFEMRREHNVQGVEYPFIESRLNETLAPRGIKYGLKRMMGKNVLEVMIVEGVWMEGRVTTSNIDRVLDLIPYLIDHPNHIGRDLDGFRVVSRPY